MEKATKITRTKEKSVRIREIQRAAKKIFFDNGFANTTMEQIARKAGVSKGTIYLYFKNKDDLYVSLMMPVLEELGRNMSEVENKIEQNIYQSKRDFLEDFLNAYKKTYEYDPDGIRIIQAFQQGNHFSAMSKETLLMINNRAMTNYAISRRLFKEGRKAGLVRVEDPVKFSDIMWAMFIGIVQLEETKFRATAKDHLMDTLNYFFNILIDGI